MGFLADAIVESTFERSTRHERMHPARRLMEPEFDWRRIAQRIHRIYSVLLTWRPDSP